MRRFLLATALAVATVGGTVVLPAAVHARADEGLERARALIEEARPWSKRAGDPDLATKDKKEARRAAHERLLEARKLFDAYLDAHPGEVESLDSEYCEMASMLYWIRKMASINEFDRKNDPEVELPATPPEPEPPAPGPKKPDPDTAGGGTTPAAPAPPTEEELLARRAAATLDAIHEQEKATPGDVPRLHTLYEKYLAEFDDPSLPGYDDAATRLGALAMRLKTVFKDEVGADPEAIDDVDSGEAKVIARRLERLLGSREVEERRRAARLLGATNSGAGAFALCKALKDDDAEVAKLAADALAGIGGTRVAYNLLKLYRDRDAEAASAALGVLVRCAQVGPVDAATMGPFIGRFVLAKDDTVANAAMDALTALGPAAGDGLVEAMETNDIEKKKRLMWAISETGYMKGAKAIANYLVMGDGVRLEALRTAAMDALKKMGLPTVPYLIDMLKSRRHCQYTAYVLRQITGQSYGSDHAKDWRKWWDENKPQ